MSLAEFLYSGTPRTVQVPDFQIRQIIRQHLHYTFLPFQTGPGAHPASCTMGTGSFPGVKCGQDMLLTTQPLLVPRSGKSRAIPTGYGLDGPGIESR